MLTMVDLISLLLCFFILFYVILENQRPSSADAWQGPLRALESIVRPQAAARGGMDRLDDRSEDRFSLDLGYVEAVLRRNSADLPELSSMRMIRTEDGLRLDLPAAGTEPGVPAPASLAALARLLANVPNPIAVDSPAPCAGAACPSGTAVGVWQQGLSRAAAAAAGLRRAGYDRPIGLMAQLPAAGDGGGRFGRMGVLLRPVDGGW